MKRQRYWFGHRPIDSFLGSRFCRYQSDPMRYLVKELIGITNRRITFLRQTGKNWSVAHLTRVVVPAGARCCSEHVATTSSPNEDLNRASSFELSSMYPDQRNRIPGSALHS